MTKAVFVIQYWKARYEQTCNRLVHDRQHHRERIHEMEQKIQHLEDKNKEQQALDHDKLVERLAIRDIEIAGQKVAVHKVEKRIAKILRQKDSQIRALQDKLEHRGGLFGWVGRLPKRVLNGLRSLFRRAEKEEEEATLEVGCFDEPQEDVYMEY